MSDGIVVVPTSACIYPGPHGERMSPEHYLPAALGKFSGCEPLRDKLCDKCNSHIGRTAEEQFLRAGPIALFRQICGITSREGNLPPSPYYRGSGGAPPIYSVGRYPGRDYDILWETGWGTQDVYPLRQIVFEHPIIGRRAIPVLDRMLKDPVALADYLKKEGIPNAKPIEVFATLEEIPAIEELLKALNYGGKAEWITTNIPQGTSIEIATTVTVSTPYFRAIAKVVFHYALAMFPDLTGNETEFAPIKEFIWQGQDLRQARVIVTELHHQVFSNFQRMRPSTWMHILAVERSYSGIIGYAQFFAGPRCLPYPYKVMIGRSPDRIVGRVERRAHQFVISEPEGIMEDLNPANYVIPVPLS